MRETLEIVITVAIVLIVSAALKLFVIDIYSVPTGSMIPTIELNDRIFTEKITPHFHNTKPQEIVTFQDPMDATRILVKRVIAIGGQTVDLRNGVVYIDNVAQDEPYTHGKPSYPLDNLAGNVGIVYPYTVPDGMIWVMGDNRTDSSDSRYFGPISENDVMAHALGVVWPLNHFGGFN
ncbi:MAG: signal peptidase I [Coriobacteriia bacterium]|nr:signal peptidase I [Coriobacteriia bacterium]